MDSKGFTWDDNVKTSIKIQHLLPFLPLLILGACTVIVVPATDPVPVAALPPAPAPVSVPAAAAAEGNAYCSALGGAGPDNNCMKDGVMVDAQTGNAIDPNNDCPAHGGVVVDDVCEKDGVQIDFNTGDPVAATSPVSADPNSGQEPASYDSGASSGSSNDEKQNEADSACAGQGGTGTDDDCEKDGVQIDVTTGDPVTASGQGSADPEAGQGPDSGASGGDDQDNNGSMDQGGDAGGEAEAPPEESGGGAETGGSE